MLVKVGDCAAPPGSCRKTPRALYDQNGKEWAVAFRVIVRCERDKPPCEAAAHRVRHTDLLGGDVNRDVFRHLVTSFRRPAPSARPSSPPRGCQTEKSANDCISPKIGRASCR